ncbi:MAG: VWA domain-containing protein [Burkholderiales bacterium]|nr:MAG: VWA domain-containing protein [Burkholderiales bacterium]
MAGSPNPFRPDALETRLAPLDALPRTLWLSAIVNNEGDPFERLAWVARARERLIGGESPFCAVPDRALPPELAEAFAPAFDRLGLVGLSRGQPAIAEQVVRSLLWHLDQIARLADAMPRTVAIERVVAAFQAEWVERGEALHEVMRLVESPDGVANFARWSELQGLLRSDSWQGILEARERVERMPQLAALIRRLGRARPREEERVAFDDSAGADGPPQWVLRSAEVELPGTPVEVEGVRRSGDPSRMLPIEALWRSKRLDPIRARRLRRLFAARLAEQSLLAWQHRDRWEQPAWVSEPGNRRVPRPIRRPVLEAGPIVVCVDTSASMSGGPERVAKAIVVQALRTAASEHRRCYVYAFSGARQVVESELSSDLDGLQRLAGFVAASFHGGTDVVEPIERALARIHEAGWRQADLLIASDGEFGPTAETVAAVQAARAALGLRVQGVLIGDRETQGMRSVVDDTFWVRDWRRYGGRHGQIDPPVHDRNLTGLFFPNISATPGTGTPLPGMRSRTGDVRHD